MRKVNWSGQKLQFGRRKMVGGWLLREHVTWSIGSGDVFPNTCGENLVGRGGLARVCRTRRDKIKMIGHSLLLCIAHGPHSLTILQKFRNKEFSVLVSISNFHTVATNEGRNVVFWLIVLGGYSIIPGKT